MHNPGVAPLHASYRKDAYEADRKWISLQDEQRNISLSVFLHIPVIADSTTAIDILPLQEWQSGHLAEMTPKVGASVAGMAAKGRYDNAVGGVAPAKKFPLLIFGPGLGWLPTDYYNIILPLVRSGVVVACIGATPISKTVYFPDGRPSTVSKPVADYASCAANLAFAADALVQLSRDSNSSVYAIIDTSNIVVGGHSVSGASALLAAYSNSRIRAVINLDGDVNDAVAGIQPAQPILYITTQPQGVSDTLVAGWAKDKSEQRRDAGFALNAAHATTAVRIKVPRMYHSDFLDIAAVKDSLEDKFRKNRFGPINQDLAYSIVVQAIQIFIAHRSADSQSWKSFSEACKNVYLTVKNN